MAGTKLMAEWFWTDRWTGSRGHSLPLHARGLYRELLTQAWRRGASLPANIEDLQKICAVTPKEWRQAWPLVEPFWRLDGDRLVNDTQLEVYAEAERRSAFFKSRASRAARARWNGASSNA